MTITPDVLTTVALVTELLRIRGTAQTANLTDVIAAVNTAIPRYCKRDWFLAANAVNPITEYASGNSRTRLTLRYGPVQAPVLTGTTTGAAATVTGLPSTSYLFAGMSAVCANFPPSTTVVSVDSASQVTLSTLATASGSAPVFFGPAVWVDNNAYRGTAPGAFSATTRLYEGIDFALNRDDPTGQESRTGFLDRIGTVWDGRWQSKRGLLTARLVGGIGNVQAVYTAGLTALPTDLQLAATKLAGAIFHAGVREGWPPGAEDLTSAAVVALDRGQWPELGSIRGLLTPYRKLRL